MKAHMTYRTRSLHCQLEGAAGPGVVLDLLCELLAVGLGKLLPRHFASLKLLVEALLLLHN
jgi:hypothetical protein